MEENTNKTRRENKNSRVIKTKITRRVINLAVLGLLFIFPLISTAEAYSEPIFKKATEKTAFIYFKEATSTASTLTLDLMLDPGGQAVNAVGTTVYFSSDIFAIESVSEEGSACTFFPDEAIDNEIGSFTFSCGAPSPGIIQESRLVEIKLKKKNQGWAFIDFTETMALANDGYSTNILDSADNLVMDTDGALPI